MTSSTPRPPAGGPIGMLLARGTRADLDMWVARSVVPLVVAPLEGWNAVLVRGNPEIGPPYDDGAMVLAARCISAKAGPALGFFVIDGRAVITVHQHRARKVRWVIWEPEHGLVRPPGLDLSGPVELLTVAGASPQLRDELVDLLHETRSRPITMMQAVLATVGMPGAQLLADPARVLTLPGAQEHRPDERQVSWFKDSVADSVRLRRELGALS